jgi:hypothetical protein
MIMRRFLNIFWLVAKYTLATVGVFVLLMVASVLPDIPGAKRFSRYVSYPDKDALIAAETNDVTSVCDCSLNGTNYVVVVMKPCRFLASGPAVLVYGPDGRLFDKTGDEGDDSRFQHTWHWRKSLSDQTEKWLRTTSLAKPMLHSPTTMGEFAEYLGQASKDFAEPLSPIARRGIRFYCNDKAAKKVFPPRSPQSETPIPDGQGHESVTFWYALTNACEQTGCTFDIAGGTVWIDPK